MRAAVILLAGFVAGTVFGVSIGAGLRLALIVLAGCLVIACAVWVPVWATRSATGRKR